jgi:hypothetical protein
MSFVVRRSALEASPPDPEHMYSLGAESGRSTALSTVCGPSPEAKADIQPLIAELHRGEASVVMPLAAAR